MSEFKPLDMQGVILADPDLTDADKVVLLGCVRCTDNATGRVVSGQAKIGARVNKSRSAVQIHFGRPEVRRYFQPFETRNGRKLPLVWRSVADLNLPKNLAGSDDPDLPRNLAGDLPRNPAPPAKEPGTISASSSALEASPPPAVASAESEEEDAWTAVLSKHRFRDRAEALAWQADENERRGEDGKDPIRNLRSWLRTAEPGDIDVTAWRKRRGDKAAQARREAKPHRPPTEPVVWEPVVRDWLTDYEACLDDDECLGTVDVRVLRFFADHLGVTGVDPDDRRGLVAAMRAAADEAMDRAVVEERSEEGTGG